ncbi:hypothetical protein CW304_27695 [Bacillus sp. UFRGS-B20]|nr:hypothetical protein CW304_27695 [Bacillus sp. UFRGS-B20]
MTPSLARIYQFLYDRTPTWPKWTCNRCLCHWPDKTLASLRTSIHAPPGIPASQLNDSPSHLTDKFRYAYGQQPFVHVDHLRHLVVHIWRNCFIVVNPHAKYSFYISCRAMALIPSSSVANF